MDTPQTAEAPMEQAQEQISYSLWQLVSYFLRLGTIGFGGPVALVGYMQRDLVEGRKWIAEADYKEGALPLSGSNAGRTGFYLAIVSDGGCPWLALYALRWSHLDAGGVLWRGCQRDRHHRPQCL